MAARSGFFYHKDQLQAEGVKLSALAERYGTPLYVYSAAAMLWRLREYRQAFKAVPHTICYSVKANSNLTLLKLLAKAGAGFDVVSGGELERVRVAARGAMGSVVFSGVGKTEAELDAGIKAGILIFNVESPAELELLAARAERWKRKTRVALRVNPDVPAETHPYISTGLREHKFGIAIEKARGLYLGARASRYLEVAGVSVHIGSQIMSIAPFAAAMERVAQLVTQLRQDGHDIRYVDAGGGLGIDYSRDGKPQGADKAGETHATNKPNAMPRDFIQEYAAALLPIAKHLRVHLLLEPGRSIVGAAGALLTRVIANKQNGSKRFMIVDAAMNDLIRPSLYGAHHEIVPVTGSKRMQQVCDVVGPVCESGDFFARDRRMPQMAAGELVAILDAGAYGMSLASNYNTRPRAAEVLVEGRKARVIRKRETVEDLYRLER